VGRSKYQPEQYEMLIKWLKVAHGYFEEYGLPRLEGGQKELYEQLSKTFFPLLRRVDETTGKMLLPALADGQSAFVLDGKWSSKRWIAALPELEKPHAMLELGIVLGVSDAALLRKAFGEYRSIINDTITKVRELIPFLPAFEIPPPEGRQIKNGTLYFYPLPEALGLDPRILPNFAMSESVAVFTLSAEHSERLLTQTPLKVAGGPLADQKSPMAGAVYFEWAGIMTTLAPWIELGLRAGGPQLVEQVPAELLEGADSDEKKLESLIQQVRTVLDVLKVFRTYSSRTYFEGKVLVTHGESILRDVEP
jgi:hypothetical protein